MDKIFKTDKKKNRLFALAFALLWGGLVLLNFLTPDQAESQAENRPLAAFPAYTTRRLLDGDFMEDMNTYLNDQFAGRPAWVGGHSLLEYGLGKREISGVYIGQNALFRRYGPENEAASAANIEGVAAVAGRYGIPTSLMLVPSATWVERAALPPLAQAWDEGNYIESVYAALGGKDVLCVDALSALSGETAEASYYRTDHHWTGQGAWLGYRALASAWGLPEREAELSVSTLSDDFLGTNHSRTGFPLVTPDLLQGYQIGQALGYETLGLEGDDSVTTEYDSIYFPEYLSQKDKYSYFLGPLMPAVTITTAAESGRKLIIFKDSYAHSLVPMLMADYSEIRLVDLRSFRAEDTGAFVQAEQYDEALFLYSTDTFSQQVGPGYLAR